MVLTTAAFVVVVLFQSVFWAPHIPLTLKAGLCLICVLSVWRPHDGLLAVAALTPFGLMLASRVFSANPGRITEAIAVSFLAGYAIRHVATRFVGRGNGQPQRGRCSRSDRGASHSVLPGDAGILRRALRIRPSVAGPPSVVLRTVCPVHTRRLPRRPRQLRPCRV